MGKVLPIQGLRCAAALAVAFLHGLHELDLMGLGGSVLPALRTLPWAAGVDVFFVISGFVIVVSSAPLFGDARTRSVFAARRVARIVPLYWLVTALVALLALASPSVLSGATLAPGYVLASFLFVPAARPDGIAQPLYSLGWTLNLEMLFYGLMTLALPLRAGAAVAAVGAALAGLVLLGSLAPPQPLAAWGDPIVLEFAAGTALGLLRLRGVALSGPVRAILAVLALASFALAPDGPRPIVWGLPALGLVAACGLGRGMVAASPGALGRAVALLGDASYATYLVHPFVLRGARLAAGLLPGGMSGGGAWIFLAAALLATLAVSVAIHRHVERPATRALRAFLERAGSARWGRAPNENGRA